MLLAPAYVQVFGGQSRLVHAWRMYHRRGVGSCAAEYYEHDARVDRYALFGLQRKVAPREFRRIQSEAEARAMGQRICTELQRQRAGSAPDVRVRLRCGTREGLETLLAREENLCGS